jgi:hypothetical protein
MAITAQKVTVGEKILIEAGTMLNIDGEEMSRSSLKITDNALPDGAEV